jgi:hypothetical protein
MILLIPPVAAESPAPGGASSNYTNISQIQNLCYKFLAGQIEVTSSVAARKSTDIAAQNALEHIRRPGAKFFIPIACNPSKSLDSEK